MARLVALTSAALAAALSLSVAQADVTVKESLSVQGQGIMAMANMSGTSTTSISGKKARTESDLQMESRLARMFARGVGQSTEIVRLDDDKIFELNTKKKTYSETSLADRRAQLEQALAKQKEVQEKQPSPTGMDESECEWSEPTADVKKTGAKASIAGYDAEQVSIVTKQSCKNKKTGAVCDVALYLDEWVAPGFTQSDEVTKYHMAYAQQMGLLNGGREVTDRAEQMFGRYKSAWAKVVDKMKDIKGYPVKTSFSMGMGGPQCQNNSPSSASSGESSGGGSAGSPTPGGLAGEIAGSLFGRKKKQQTETASSTPATPPPAAMNGMVVPLTITSELISVSKDSLSADTFEVPAGFKKVATRD
jgi:hypothetical protein